MIELQGVEWRARQTAQGAGIDLKVAGSAAVAIVGPVGVGKTPLTAIAAARARPSSGSVLLFGRDAARLRASSLAAIRRRIGYAPQVPEFFDDETLLANVGLPVALDGAPSAEVCEAAGEALEIVGLGDAAGLRARELSGGDRRRAAIARAIVGQPPIIVADDPIAGLDLDTATHLISILERMRDGGAAVLVASAEPRLDAAARHLAWEVHELSDGAFGAPAQARSRTPTDPGDEAPQNIVPFPARAAGGGP